MNVIITSAARLALTWKSSLQYATESQLPLWFYLVYVSQ